MLKTGTRAVAVANPSGVGYLMFQRFLGSASRAQRIARIEKVRTSAAPNFASGSKYKCAFFLHIK
jgi:hypothetical protein